MIKPLRSVLYVPGNKERALQKTPNLLADGFIFDLEDAVAPEHKQRALKQVLTTLAQVDYGYRQRIIRVNALDTPWGYQDLIHTATSHADAVLLPKVDGPETLKQAASLLSHSGAPKTLELWCMLETPLGVLNVKDIVQATPRLRVLVMGNADLTNDLHAQHTPDRAPLMTSFGLCLLAAHAYGLRILDGVHLQLNDQEGFLTACQQAKDLGFDGKTLIHPQTITTANTLFSPTEHEIQTAKNIMNAYEKASLQGQAIITLDGRLVEALHVNNAQRILELAASIEAATHML